MDINEIRKALSSGVVIEYKAHCLKRMLERGISRKDIVDCIMNGEIIEDYPLDNNMSTDSFPSCLILLLHSEEKNAIHTVIGFNGKKIIVITAYYPDKEQWDDTFSKRKER